MLNFGKNKKKEKEAQAVTLRQSQQAILNEKTAFVIQEAYKQQEQI